MAGVRTSHLAVDRITPQYGRVTFDHGPINTITGETVEELSHLVDEIERDEDFTVVLFTGSNRDLFLAHYDTEADPAKTVSMPPGPTGMHPWLDLTARLSRALASFDKQAIAETKTVVDATTLPDDNELAPALTAFFASAARPATQARLEAPGLPGLRARQRARAAARRGRPACDAMTSTTKH